MKPFAKTLAGAEIKALAVYVTEAFVSCGKVWPAYHTPENGWPDHEKKYRAAYPYALGEASVQGSEAGGQEEASLGLRLFKEACSVCHEPSAGGDSLRSILADAGSAQASSQETHGEAHDHDEEYATVHDEAPLIPNLTAEEARGEALYQANCATCHAADGTGQNWIGSFLQPHPTDFTNPSALEGKDEEALIRGILDGVPGTSMSAFRSVLSPNDAKAIIAYMKRAFADR